MDDLGLVYPCARYIMARGLVIWSPEQLRYLERIYVRQSLPPRMCVEEVNRRFKTSFTIEQVRNAIETRGFSKRRRKVSEEFATRNDVGRQAIQQTEKHQAAMDRFVSQAEVGADRAAQFMQTARSARDLASAVSAHKGAVTTYRLCAGLDGPGASGSGNQFVFNFAASFPQKQMKRVEGEGVTEAADPPQT